jgi:hypothetical protein
MKIEEKLYKEKYLKKRATKINYNMHEIKPSYCSGIPSNKKAWL